MSEPGNAWIDGLLIAGAAVAGIAAKLGLNYTKRHEEAIAKGTVARGLTLGETIAALIAAPVIGYMANAVGQWQGWDTGISAGVAGFAGLVGPAALLAFWERAVDPMLVLLRRWAGLETR